MKSYLGRFSVAVLTLLLFMIFTSPLQAGISLSGFISQEVVAQMPLGFVVPELSVEQAESTKDLLNPQVYEILAAGDTTRTEVEFAVQELIILVDANGAFEVLQFRLFS